MLAPAVVLVSSGFEGSTSLPAGFTASGTGAGRVRVLSQYARTGTNCAALDTGTNGTLVYSRLDMAVPVNNHSNVVLTYYLREFGDETHAEDGLFFTVNGTTWHQILNFSTATSSYALATVNLSTEAANRGLALGANTKVRWQYYDDSAITSDGYAIDDIAVNANAAPTGPSVKPGMGAEPFVGGVTFRTWAPNATAVRVAGSFNGWSSTSHPMYSEGNGNWSVDNHMALIGDQYLYVIVNGGTTLWKQDPRSRQLTNSVGNSIIRNDSYDWAGGTTSVVYSDNFEAATLNPSWVISTTNNGRVQRNTTYKAAGAAGMSFDCSTGGTLSYSRADLGINMSNTTAGTLTFKFRNVGDEAHTQDGVYISATGSTWVKTSWVVPSISASFSTQNINLYQEAVNLGVARGAQFKVRFQQYDDSSLSSDGMAIDDVSVSLTTSAPNFTMPSWNEVAIYQAHIGTFNDSPGGNPGTFNSAVSKLDHVRDLGMSVIQLLPIMEFGSDFSWGYNPMTQYAPESIYGSPDNLRNFIKEAHNRNLAVFMDVVYNHMGPSDLSMWQYDGWQQNNKGGIYFYQDWRSSTPWGDTRPDYGRGEVRTFLKDSALFWLNQYRVDGLRWDSTVNIRTQNNGGGGDIPDGWSLMQYINNEIDAASGWKISIAEDLQNNEWLVKTTGSGGAGFDSQWDAQFVHPIRDALITGNDSSRNMYSVRDAIQHYYDGTALKRVIYTESHDEVANGKSRVPEEIWPGNAGSWASKKRSSMGGALVYTSPGMPMMFMGQEFVEDGYWADTDPLDWAKATTYSGMVNMYRDMVRLRRNWYNNTRGLRGNNVNVFHVNDTNKVVAFHRWDAGGAGDDCVVICNFANTTYTSYNLGFPQSGNWYVRFNSDWNGYSSDFGNWNSYNTTAGGSAKDGLPYNGNVGIGAYSVIILSR